ncbi:hypothetical protein NEMBOFW57_002388 [Staphylotrichum longicolle]|uniref:HhH-GPD domain-containing protein n=1 Tax=Staphylotrichum longicolle TaxID=669026 RepID=A0AAD4I4P1_9PEZI|nr:hypothetical protein NEMBOFW57_002388 [Staphylotrichum longicolle]
MSDSPTSSGVAARAPPAAEELLYGFDIPDEETREFLREIIASGRAPRAEVDGLRELSLMRGVEEWQMMFECAEALRNGAGGLAWGTVSSLPIPPLSADCFGLIQEELADDPFRLLIAITFLIRTAGKAAIPVFRQLMQRFPTPAALAAADPAEISALIHPLGLSAVRCATIQKYARLWLERPPSREVRYGVKNYPLPGDGRHVKAAEEFGPEDGGRDGPADAVMDAKERAVGCAWEIGHLTQGPYALDSWRIFCRDVLLGRSGHWTGRAAAAEFQPEWMREREPLREDMRRAVNEGRVGYDDSGNLVILE